jgi:hypothetical protein
LTPVAFSNRWKSSTGRGAEPEKAVFTVETSAFTGRCIIAAMAVGTVMMKVTLQRSTSFQKLSKTPSPR